VIAKVRPPGLEGRLGALQRTQAQGGDTPVEERL
jgi:hypothetical protein